MRVYPPRSRYHSSGREIPLPGLISWDHADMLLQMGLAKVFNARGKAVRLFRLAQVPELSGFSCRPSTDQYEAMLASNKPEVRQQAEAAIEKWLFQFKPTASRRQTFPNGMTVNVTEWELRP